MAWHNIDHDTAIDLIAIVNTEIIRRETDRPETTQSKLRAFEQGLRERLTQSDAEKAYFEAARANFHSEGELEFDEGGLVSISEDGGAYVMAWQWISNDEACVCDTCGETYEEGGDGFDGNCPSCADYTDQIENPDSYFSMEDWQAEVAAGDTKRGYEDWKAAQIEQAKDALKQRQKDAT